MSTIQFIHQNSLSISTQSSNQIVACAPNFVVFDIRLLFIHIFNSIEANSTAPESEENEWKGRGGERSGTVKTPTSGTMQTENTGKVKFDPPSVPVIFVLGNRKTQSINQLHQSMGTNRNFGFPFDKITI